MEIDRELLKGSISLLLLNLLAERDMYGYEIIRETARRSHDAFAFKEGTLYPALHHLEKQRLLRSEWRVADNGRERKYYTLTPKGKEAARESQRSWLDFTGAINAILAGG